jgi:hypothetical protein
MRHVPTLWSVCLALLVLAPTLAPGYVLTLDMVFVPSQTLLPWNLGIGAGLPRSVPQDAVVSLLAGPLPGQLLQKVVLSGSLVLAGVGAGRLAGSRVAVQVPAASLYLWSAFLAQRLLMGHWAVLWAFALLPWVVLAARRARSTGRWYPAVALCGVGALVPTGGLLLAVACVPLLVVPGSRVTARGRAAAAGLVALFNAPWALPAVRGGVAEASDPLGVEVFGARADTPGGVVLSVLGGGGVWNSQAVLPSRGTWFAVFATVLVVGLAGVGWRRWSTRAGSAGLCLAVLAATGTAWALVTGVAADQQWVRDVVGSVPGGGLLRDGQKWAVFWVLLVSVCAPHGLAVLVRRFSRGASVFLAGALALLPLSAMPDLAWGGFGRLTPVGYPSAWGELRARVAAPGACGDVLSLPWTAFRRYAWNGDRVVLDPLPRYLTRTVVWNDQLPVTWRGTLVRVGGDDPRAEQVTEAIVAGRPLEPVMRALGIRFVVVQTDQPVPGAAPDVSGLTQVWAAPGLVLLEARGAVIAYEPRDPVVVAVDLLALTGLVGVSMWAVGTRGRGRAEEAGVSSQRW